MIIFKEEIINRINRGDVKAFEQLYSSYYVYLCAVAVKYVFHAEAAQEIVNDVFLNVWNNKTELIYPVNSYLIRAVKNRCINYITRRRMMEVPLTDVQEQLLTIQEEQIALERDEHPLSYLEDKEFEQLIYDAIQALPPRCRSIFEQYLYQNKTYEEIARDNNIATSTVRVQIKLGLTRIKDVLGHIYPLFLLLFNFSEN